MELIKRWAMKMEVGARVTIWSQIKTPLWLHWLHTGNIIHNVQKYNSKVSIIFSKNQIKRPCVSNAPKALTCSGSWNRQRLVGWYIIVFHSSTEFGGKTQTADKEAKWNRCVRICYLRNIWHKLNTLHDISVLLSHDKWTRIHFDKIRTRFSRLISSCLNLTLI